jgi:hypothetical protein
MNLAAPHTVSLFPVIRLRLALNADAHSGSSFRRRPLSFYHPVKVVPAHENSAALRFLPGRRRSTALAYALTTDAISFVQAALQPTRRKVDLSA